MNGLVLFTEKIVMFIIKIARIFKLKTGDTTEDSILEIIDQSFESIFG